MSFPNWSNLLAPPPDVLFPHLWNTPHRKVCSSGIQSFSQLFSSTGISPSREVDQHRCPVVSSAVHRDTILGRKTCPVSGHLSTKSKSPESLKRPLYERVHSKHISTKQTKLSSRENFHENFDFRKTRDRSHLLPITTTTFTRDATLEMGGHQAKGLDPAASIWPKAQLNKDSGEGEFEEADVEGDAADIYYKNGQAIACVVCGDKSSGKHYGQHTCEGCKSFFKRSVRRKLTYTCRASRQCPIDIHHRNQCQYCRFQKCVKAGMRKEAVQQGRLPQIHPLYQPFVGSSHQPSTNGSYLGPNFYSHYIAVLLQAESLSQRKVVVEKSFFPGAIHGDRAKPADVLEESREDTHDWSKASPLSAGAAMDLLINAIDWTRNISLFTELQPVDQFNLLNNNWPQLMVLMMAQEYLPMYVATTNDSGTNIHTESSKEAAELTFGKSKQPDPSDYPTDSLADEKAALWKRLQEQVDQWRHLHLDLVEYVCLKGIVLFNSESPELIEPSSVDRIQEKIQSALEEYDRSQFTHQRPFRCGRLLLRLPKLGQLSSNCMKELLFPQAKDQIEQVIQEVLFSKQKVNNIEPHGRDLQIPYSESARFTRGTPEIASQHRSHEWKVQKFSNLQDFRQILQLKKADSKQSSSLEPKSPNGVGRQDFVLHNNSITRGLSGTADISHASFGWKCSDVRLRRQFDFGNATHALPEHHTHCTPSTGDKKYDAAQNVLGSLFPSCYADGFEPSFNLKTGCKAPTYQFPPKQFDWSKLELCYSMLRQHFESIQQKSTKLPFEDELKQIMGPQTATCISEESNLAN